MSYNPSQSEVHRLLENYDRDLAPDDPRFQRSVHLVFTDGSSQNWNAAFLMRAGSWIIVLTEQQGSHIFTDDELQWYWESQKLHIPLEELK